MSNSSSSRKSRMRSATTATRFCPNKQSSPCANTSRSNRSTDLAAGKCRRPSPLRNVPELERRQQMIADLMQEPDLLAAIRTELKSIRDIERAAGRLSQASGNARDLVALKTSLQQIPKLKAELQKLLDRLAFGRAPVEAAV